MLILELPRPFQASGLMVVGNLLVDALIRLLQESGQIDTAQIDAHRQVPFVHLSRDGAGSGRHPHLCHLRKGNLRPGSGRQQQVADLLRRVAALVVEAADYVVALTADKDLRDGGATDR